MAENRRLSRIQIYRDDTVFFYDPFSILPKPFLISIERITGRTAFQGEHGEFSDRQHQNFVVGGQSHWEHLVYPMLDRNPIFLMMIQRPMILVLELYWRTACGIANRASFPDPSEQVPAFPLAEFLGDEQYTVFVDNPQWTSLLRLNDVWRQGMQENLSIQGQWNLVRERLEQMPFFGLSEYPYYSMDLCSYTFFSPINPKQLIENSSLKIFDPEFQSEIVSTEIRTELQNRLRLDARLYRFAEVLFRNRYREMALRLAGEENRFKNRCVKGNIIPLLPEEQFNQFDLRTLRAINRIRKKIFQPGSRNEELGRKIYQGVQQREKSSSKLNDGSSDVDPEFYRSWLAEKETHVEGTSVESAYSFSFLVVCGSNNFDRKSLQLTLESLKRMNCVNWEAVVIRDDFLGNYEAVEYAVVEEDSRIRNFLAWKGSFEDLVECLAGDYVLVMRAGDCLKPDTLAMFNSLVSDELKPVDILYFDEDYLDENNQRCDPWFKPGTFSPEMLFSVNYLSHAFYHRHLLYGPWASRMSTIGSGEMWNLAFRCVEASRGEILHLSSIVYHSGKAEIGMAGEGKQKENENAAISAALERKGLTGGQVSREEGDVVRARWNLKEKDQVSIIIPTKDRFTLLRRCVDTINKITDYPSFEVILVDTGSRDPRIKAYYKLLGRQNKARIVDYRDDFNYSKANNLGAMYASGDYLLFLNNDTEPLCEDWLSELVQWASLPGIGAVSPKLLFPKGTIQFFGTILGMRGHAGHVFADLPESAETMFGSTGWYRNCTAATGACMMVPRQVFQEVGEFDTEYQIAFGDVDLGLKIINAGYRILCTPFSRVRHYEGRSRLSYVPVKDMKTALNNFGRAIEDGDIYFNPNLTLDSRIPALKQKDEPEPVKKIAQVMFDRDNTRIS